MNQWTNCFAPCTENSYYCEFELFDIHGRYLIGTVFLVDFVPFHTGQGMFLHKGGSGRQIGVTQKVTPVTCCLVSC